MIGGLLLLVIVSLIIFVLLRRMQIKRKRTVRRLLQEREVKTQLFILHVIDSKMNALMMNLGLIWLVALKYELKSLYI